MKIIIDTQRLEEVVRDMDGIMHVDDMPTVLWSILEAAEPYPPESESAKWEFDALKAGLEAECTEPGHEYD